MDDENETYGQYSELVKALRQTQGVDDAKNAVKAALAAGLDTPDIDVSYGAGDPGFKNPKFDQDLITMLDVAHSSQAAQVTLALGSYTMTAHIVGNDAKTRTATVAFVGSNPISLGSAMATAGGMRELGESLTPSSGPLSTVTQHFGWLQTITY